MARLTAARILWRVVGPARGRRRAGRAFGTGPVLLDPAALPEAEREAIRADPLLAVEEVAGPSAPASDDG